MSKTRQQPSMDPNSREKQLVNLAINLAEQQLIEGTASPSVITHFLKLGSSNAELEKEKLRNENLLLEAKQESIQQSADMNKIMEEALEALKTYR